ncbi:hypothetical protein [Ilumatobacter sp.]|uniref:hypothetical protein n=1 Tax=Ilumatobacter sp. TaxID=1967498 RepID=UPI003B5266BC
MTPTAVAAAAALGVVTAAAAGWRAARRPRLTLRDVRHRTHRGSVAPSGAEGPVVARLGSLLASGPLGRFVEDRAGRSVHLLGTTVPVVVGQVVAAAVIALVATTLMCSALVAVGAVAPSPLMSVLVIAATVLFAWRIVADVRARAERRRRELRRVVNDFVQLLAVALTTNRSVEDAIDFAADAGDGDGFDLLRRTVETARPMGITVWDALAAMSQTYDLPELRGLTTSLQRQAGVGVSVAATVRTEAAAMRARQLDELTDRADAANANLSLPTMGMVFGMVAFLAYPVVTQITEAF